MKKFFSKLTAALSAAVMIFIAVPIDTSAEQPYDSYEAILPSGLFRAMILTSALLVRPAIFLFRLTGLSTLPTRTMTALLQ